MSDVQRLIHGEFAPVHWEPLGPRGERLVIGFVLALDGMPATAHATLNHKRLDETLGHKKSASAFGIIKASFDFFDSMLEEGKAINELQPAFASVTIGPKARITARTPQEALDRATDLCTLLGEMPSSQKSKSAQQQSPHQPLQEMDEGQMPTDYALKKLWKQHPPTLSGVVNFAREVLNRWGSQTPPGYVLVPESSTMKYAQAQAISQTATNMRLPSAVGQGHD